MANRLACLTLASGAIAEYGQLGCPWERKVINYLGSSWTQVARRDEIFTEWNVALAPTELRFLRFSVPRRTFLHLSRVQVWR